MDKIFRNVQYHSKLIQIAQFYFSIVAFYANVERFFPWWSHKPKRKRIFSGWTSFQSVEAGVQFKTSFMQAIS